MASVDKVKIEDATYDISPSPTGTLDATSTTKFTSNDVDQDSATSYTSINKIDATETNSSIFSKLTSMVRNIRYLHNKIGTTDISDVGDNVTDAISKLNTKAPIAHSHTIADLPVSNNQVNSSNYIPTSALIYSMRQNLIQLNGATDIGSNFITDIDCGGISSGTRIYHYDALRSIIKGMLYVSEPPTGYESRNLGTWSSIDQVNDFFDYYRFGHWGGTGSRRLNIGNYVTIQDGTYNIEWEIAGFDCEHNQLAADGTVYDNGYGICMIPRKSVKTVTWSDADTVEGGYKSSTMHTSHLVTLANSLKTILGDHLINRNVLLSSSVDIDEEEGYCNSNAYEWTTAYCTLMSIGQITGTFASHNTKYDDGEANYKLPVFDYESFGTTSRFESRGIADRGVSNYYIWAIPANASPNRLLVTTTSAMRPLIYLR